MDKTCIIPLWPIPLDDFAGKLARICPRAGNCKISSSIRYLGPFIGPGGVSKSWMLPVKNFMEAALTIRAQQLGFTVSLYSFVARALPRLGYIASYLAPTGTVLQAETRALSLLSVGPFRAIPKALF